MSDKWTVVINPDKAGLLAPSEALLCKRQDNGLYQVVGRGTVTSMQELITDLSRVPNNHRGGGDV